MKSGLDAMPLFLLDDLLIYFCLNIFIETHGKQPGPRSHCAVYLCSESDKNGEVSKILHSSWIESCFDVKSLQNVGSCCWDVYR